MLDDQWEPKHTPFFCEPPFEKDINKKEQVVMVDDNQTQSKLVNLLQSQSKQRTHTESRKH